MLRFFNLKKPPVIPMKMHFNWGMFLDGSPLPIEHQQRMEALSQKNPEWEFEVHGPESIDKYAASYLGDVYAEYPRHIQRSDACRPMLLHKYGGVYSDFDVDAFKGLSKLMAPYSKAKLLLFEEWVFTQKYAQRIANQHPIREGRPEHPHRIANYFMASVPGHPFWLDVLALMKERSQLTIKEDYDVIYTTGPDVITEVAHQWKDAGKDIQIVPLKRAGKLIKHWGEGGWRDDA